MSIDFYKVLDVPETATQEEIKKTYRALSFKHHPDKNGNNIESTQLFQKINEAYETLGNPEKRAEYDILRTHAHRGGIPSAFFMHHPAAAASAAQAANVHHQTFMMHQMDDLLNNLFFGGGIGPGANVQFFHAGGGGGVPGAPINPSSFSLQKPSPITKAITISMEQVLEGAVVPVEIERWTIENTHKVHEQETIYVKVPQGIDEGEVIVLKERGNVVNETTKGDIKIQVKIRNDTAFVRTGLDLVFEKHISLKEALCGFSFEMKFINGKTYTLNGNKGNIIPPEWKKVYPNLGLQRGDHRGKLIIHFHVDFPETLTEEQISQLETILP